MTKWFFPTIGFGELEGFSNPGLEMFKGEPLRAMAREIVQNSLDAIYEEDKPVYIEFDNKFISPVTNFPGMENMRVVIDKCREFWKEENEDKTMKFISEADKRLRSSGIFVLRVSDYNTTGLRGAFSNKTITPWKSLVQGNAFSVKNSDSAGGSYGIGKAAPFVVSKLQTVFYRTYDVDGVRAAQAKREKREFYIPRQEREKNLFGSEFEVKLRNEMTQKAIAKECAEWIRKKAVFKSNVTNENMMGFINVDDKNYMPLSGFTTVDLGCERGNNAYYMVQKSEAPMSTAYLQLFEQIWNDSSKLQEVTDEVIENITTVYNENSPNYLYFVTLYNIFNEFLEDVSDDVLPNEATGFKESKIWGMLYNFQKDAALAIINKLEKYNGCILADSVGLGKTFTALSVIKYYENRNKSVLVLCPKKLANNWNTYKYNYINNPIAADRMRYDVLFHTDLSRESGNSNGMDLDMVNWGNYDLVVIDESHNFRNGGKISGENEKENRYLKLLNKVIRKGVKTKVLMLSATPVNNRFVDLKNQIALAYEGESQLLDEKLNTHKSIDDIFKQAQTAFNTWSKWEPEDRTTSKLLSMLDFDFFELLDSVTIARSRKHIQKYYDTSDIGTFPKRNPPISKRPGLTDLSKAINYNEIFEQLNLLRLCIYTPTDYILPSKLAKYKDVYDSNHVKGGLTQSGREQGIRRLMSINLMKRMESSVYSFRLTLKRINDLITDTIKSIADCGTYFL